MDQEKSIPTNKKEYSPEELEIYVQLKKRADIKGNIIRAVEKMDVDEVVKSLKEARFYLLELDQKSQDERERKDRLHAERGGWWEREFTKLFSRMRSDQEKGITDGYYNFPGAGGELHLDEVNRFRLTIDKRKILLSIMGGSISAPEVVNRWRLVEQSYDLYNDLDPQLRKMVEESSS